MEKRANKRFAVDGRISLTGGTFVGEGRLVNVSLGGFMARITKTTQGLEPGMHVQVCLWLPDDPSPVTVADAGVRWSMGREVGVEFIYLESEDKAHLNRGLERVMDTLTEEQG